MTDQNPLQGAPEAAAKPAATPVREEIAPLRTLKGDIGQAIKHQNLSLAGIALREADRRRFQLESQKKTSTLKVILISLSVIFLLGAAALAGFFYWQSKPAGPGESGATVSTGDIISVDQSKKLDVVQFDAEGLQRALTNLVRAEEIRIGSIEKIEIVETIESPDKLEQQVRLGADEFLTKLEVGVSDRFLRFLDRPFLFGIHSFKTNSGFLLLKTGSFQTAFAELLSWEKVLAADLYQILSGNRPAANLLERAWEDKTIKNIDTRVLFDQAGEIALIYSFLGSRDTIFIGTNRSTFEEVLARFQTPRQVVQ